MDGHRHASTRGWASDSSVPSNRHFSQKRLSPWPLLKQGGFGGRPASELCLHVRGPVCVLVIQFLPKDAYLHGALAKAARCAHAQEQPAGRSSLPSVRFPFWPAHKCLHAEPRAPHRTQASGPRRLHVPLLWCRWWSWCAQLWRPPTAIRSRRSASCTWRGRCTPRARTRKPVHTMLRYRQAPGLRVAGLEVGCRVYHMYSLPVSVAPVPALQRLSRT